MWLEEEHESSGSCLLEATFYSLSSLAERAFGLSPRFPLQRPIGPVMDRCEISASAELLSNVYSVKKKDLHDLTDSAVMLARRENFKVCWCRFTCYNANQILNKNQGWVQETYLSRVNAVRFRDLILSCA